MIEKRGANSWRYGVQVNTTDGPQWIRETVKFPANMTEAAQRKEVAILLARLQVDIADGKIRPIEVDYTVRRMADQWMTDYVLPECSDNYAKTVRSMLHARILPALGDVPLRDITPVMITRFINSLRKSTRITGRKADDQLTRKRPPSDVAKMTATPDKTLSPKTVRDYYDCLNTMLDMAVSWQLLRKNPMDGLKRPRVPRTRAQFLTDERAVQLLRCLANEPNMCYRAAVLLALLCGLRLGEVGALRLSDVDWANGTIEISRALKYSPDTGNTEGPPKSDAGYRQIALPPAMMALLHETREYQRDMAAMVGDLWVGEGWIVHAWNGARLAHGTPSKWFKRFAARNGFEGVKFHSLRHTHATILLANNIDAVAVASRLGHGDATVTLHTYAHALRRRDTDAANVAQALIDRAGVSLVPVHVGACPGDMAPPPQLPPECAPSAMPPDCPPPPAPPPA